MTLFQNYFRSSLVIISVWIAGIAVAQENFATVWSSYVGYDYDTDKVLAVAADSATNSYLGGTLGGWQIHNNAGDDFFTRAPGFVARVSAGGTLTWVADFSDYDNFGDEVKGLALGGQGQLAAVGLTKGSDADEGTYAFVSSLGTTDGVVSWHHTLGNYFGTNSFNAVAVAADGSVYAVGHTSVSGLVCNVTGYQSGGVTYGKELKGDIDAVIVKYDANGNVLWRHYLGGVNADTANACAIAANGYVYVAGETRSPGWAALASGAPDATHSAGFIVKLTAGGAHVWSSFLNGSADDAVKALRLDAAASALFLGGVTASSDFLSSATRFGSYGGNSDGFVVKLTDTNTAFRTDWCRFAGGNTADSVTSLGLLADGRIAAGGATGSGAWLTHTEGGDAFSGVRDGFVTLLNTNGTVSWSTYVGGANADEVLALATVSNTCFSAGSTFSPNWVGGGFWDTWSKNDMPGTTNAFGFVVQWQPGAPIAPAITADPSGLSVREGAPATFSVTATGTAPLFYRWYRNGVPVTGLTSNSYTLAAAAFSDSGAEYSCLASNVAGTAASGNATLTVTAMGVLTVALAPAGAVSQGAMWSLDSGATWLAGGSSTNLEVGPYTVTFANLTGWRAPAALAAVEVLHGMTTATSGVYTAILPSAERVIAGTNVNVTVRAPAGLSTWTLVETLQAGLTPIHITAGGVWNGTALTLTFTGVEATTNLLSYAVLCVTSGVYTVGGTVTPQPANTPVAVAGDTRIIKANFIRTITGNAVAITVNQSDPTKWWVVTETIPEWLTPSGISSGGTWSSSSRTITWFTIGTGAPVSYTVTGEPKSYQLSGNGTIQGASEPIFGDSVLTIPGAEVPVPDIIGFIPSSNSNVFVLTFTSVVDQAYVILTNATLGATNGWAVCLPVAGEAGTTQREVPVSGPRLFYRVRVVE